MLKSSDQSIAGFDYDGFASLDVAGITDFYSAVFFPLDVKDNSAKVSCPLYIFQCRNPLIVEDSALPA